MGRRSRHSVARHARPTASLRSARISRSSKARTTPTVICRSCSWNTPATTARIARNAFAATDPQLAAVGAIFVRFEFPGEDRGRIDLEMESGTELLTDGAKQHVVLDATKKVRLAYDDNFEWRAARSSCLMSKEKHAATAYVVVFTTPADAVDRRRPTGKQWYKEQREKCVKTWNDLLAAGTNVRVPEPYVNNAWRSLLVGTYMIYAGEQLNYSAGNQYARKYAHESGESMRSLLLWGHEKDAADSIPPIFKYRRGNIEFHDGGFKLEGLAALLLRHARCRAGPQHARPVAARDRPDREVARSEDRPLAARKVLQRHRNARHLDQRQRQLLARPARHGARARRHRRDRAGGKAGQDRGRLSQGHSGDDRQGDGSQRRSAIPADRARRRSRCTTRSPARDWAATGISSSRRCCSPASSRPTRKRPATSCATSKLAAGCAWA